jgi:hypothetical protein
MFLSILVGQKLQLEFWWGSIGGLSWIVSLTTRILNYINLGLGHFFPSIVLCLFISIVDEGDNQYVFPFNNPKIDEIIPFDNKMFYTIHDTIIQNFVACTI